MHNFAENGRCAPQSYGHEASDYRYLEHPDRGMPLPMFPVLRLPDPKDP
jgi:hypothetical protein